MVGMASAIELVSRIQALLIDMDGTLVDSNAAVERVWADWARSVGADPAEVLAFCHGQPLRVTKAKFGPPLSEAEMDEAVVAHDAREVVELDGVKPAEGSDDLLE